MNLHDTTSFGELRSLLQSAPASQATWRAICRTLEGWEDDERLRHEVLPYLQTHLEKWPTEILREAAPSWLVRVLHARRAPAIALTRQWHLHPGMTADPSTWARLSSHNDALHTLRATGLSPEAIAHALRGARELRTLEVEADNTSVSALTDALGEGAGAHLRTCSLRGLPVRDQDLQALADAAPGLTTLRLVGHRLTDNASTVFANAPWALEHLTMSGTSMPTGDFLDHLLWEADLERLEFLDLGSCRLGDDGAYLLTDNDVLPALHTLKLPRCELTAFGVRELGNIEHLSGLQHLDLSGNARSPGVGITDAIGHVARSPHLPHLKELVLRHTGLLEDAIVELLRLRPRLLSLGNNDLGDRAARQLSMSTDAHRLEELDLRDTTLTSEGVTFLAQSRMLPALHTLTLWGPHLDTEALQTLMHGPLCGQLKEVNISGLPLSEAGVRAAQRSPHLYGWERLTLGGFGQTLTHTLGLLRAPGLRTLRHVDLGPVDDLGVFLRELSTLDLPHLRSLRAQTRHTTSPMEAILRFLKTPMGRRMEVMDVRWDRQHESWRALSEDERLQASPMMAYIKA